MTDFPGVAGRLVALFAAIATSPIVIAAVMAIWMQDRRAPFYLSTRVGLEGRLFKLIKLRSMVTDADRSKVDTTVADDPRITRMGHLIRKFKLDELPQFWNVVLGDMAIVGPRPNVSRETALYTSEELRMLSIKPGITDFSSIVFSDLGTILTGACDPNIAYNQLIRPWKSRLALFYIDNRTWIMDLYIVAFTAVSIVNRKLALHGVTVLLQRHNASQRLVEIAMRRTPLTPTAPPGSNDIVISRHA